MKPKLAYEDILRAIGQRLENFGAVVFELENSGGEFVVSGECQKMSAAPKAIRKKSFLSLLQNVGARKNTAKPHSPNFHFSGLRFNQNDIEQLSRKGRALRSGVENRMPNPYSLPQVLRLAGTYLDRTESQLSKLSWRYPVLSLWHINRLGHEMNKVFTLPEMYDFWVRQFKKRTPPLPLKSTGS